MLACMLLEYQHRLRSDHACMHAQKITYIADVLHRRQHAPSTNIFTNAAAVMDYCSLDTVSLLHLSFVLLDHPAEQPSDTQPPLPGCQIG